MTVHKIVLLADPVLRQKASPIDRVDDGIRQLLDDMVETMYEAVGIGLAAPQIGISKRLIVMDCAKDDNPPEIWKMINPEIISRSEETTKMEEGCLSIPGYNGDVTRPAEVRVRYMDIEGNSQEMTATGLLAACVQHEIDHLDGVLFIDYLSRLKRDMILRKIAKDPVFK
jgi:peptide deformylase